MRKKHFFLSLQEFNSVSTRCILTDNSKSINLQATLNQTLRFILYTICHIQINLTSCLKTVIGIPISPMYSEEYHANATQQGNKVTANKEIRTSNVIAVMQQY